MSNTCTVALPDLYFHWPRQAVASFVFRARGIVLNHLNCFVLQSQTMSGKLLTFFLTFVLEQ